MTNNSSYKSIVKSTGIIGGSKFFTIVIGVIRTKAIAILLGSSGIGIISLYTSAISVIQNFAHLGLGFSSVKDIAESVISNDQSRISKTIITLRRWVWFTGLFGVVLVILFSSYFSILTFGDDSHQLDFILLSVNILFSAISGGQMALLRGYRRITDLAKANIWGSLLGLCVTIPIYYFYEVKGIVPVLILTTLINLALSFFYSRKVKVEKIILPFKESFRHGKSMLRLGFFTVVAGLMTTTLAYLLRLYLNNYSGIEMVGLFTVASTLSIYYLDILLSTLGTDYFPRLSEVNNNHPKMIQLVNEQTLITILLGVPLVAFMIVSSKAIILLFYTPDFLDATNLLVWMLLGVSIRLISWPKGFVILSKSKGMYFVMVQAIWNVTYVGTSILLLPKLGLEGIGIAFVLAYVISYIVNFILVRKVIKFSYSANTLKTSLILFGLLLLIFLIMMLLPKNIKYYPAVALFILLFGISLYKFNTVIPLKEIASKVRGKLNGKN